MFYFPDKSLMARKESVTIFALDVFVFLLSELVTIVVGVDGHISGDMTACCISLSMN